MTKRRSIAYALYSPCRQRSNGVPFEDPFTDVAEKGHIFLNKITNNN